MDIDKEHIKNILLRRSPQRIENGAFTRAAVLLPLFRKENTWHVLFTKRSENLPTHSGEVSFPGGALDEGENAVDAVLRETEEEVGISPRDMEILGRLDESLTMTQYRVTPFVGIIPYPCEFTVSEYEIEDVFDVSIPDLMDPENFRRRRWTVGGKSFPLYFFEGGKHTIWGLTGRILKQFLELVFEWREPEYRPGVDEYSI